MATEIYAVHAKRIRRYNKASFRLACRIVAMLCDHRLPFQSYSFQRPPRFRPFHRVASLYKLKRSQLSAICHLGQSGDVINKLACHCLLLGLSSVASGPCTVVQISLSLFYFGLFVCQGFLPVLPRNFEKSGGWREREKKNTDILQNCIENMLTYFQNFFSSAKINR